MTDNASDHHGSHSAKRDAVLYFRGLRKLRSDVNYRPSNFREDACSECRFYRNPSETQSPCSKVAGLVDANGTCDEFVKIEPVEPDNGAKHTTVGGITITISTGQGSKSTA